jgi:CubicO group peptidase (beta-lactamase class C family)
MLQEISYMIVIINNHIKKLLSIVVLGLLLSGNAYANKEKANSHGGAHELPESARPNDATISLFEVRKKNFIDRRRSQGRLYTVPPKGNAKKFTYEKNISSSKVDRQLSKGFLLSYLFYDNGVIKYDGRAKKGRFKKDITNETLFFTHSTGKSLTSYIVGHAICDGYISSIDEIIDWPLMENTLYQGQPLRNLLNMSAGDQHVVYKRTSRFMGSSEHHRNMSLDTIAYLLDGTKAKGNKVFYNNALSDIIANYVVFKAGDNYDELMKKVFQDKIKIENEVSYEKHGQTRLHKKNPEYNGSPQTLASYSYYMTRLDFLRVAEAMMKDYQNKTCVGNYLRESQQQAKKWPKYNPSGDNARISLHNSAYQYGSQFYFNFSGMSKRNIIATDGLNGQYMLIDLDNSKIVITNSAARGWNVKTLALNVIKKGKLPN